MYEYRIYNIKEIGIAKKTFEGTPFNGISNTKTDTVLSLTDYNKLREILGYEKVSLQDDEIIINCLKTAKGTFEKSTKENLKIRILEKDFKIKEIRSENIAQIGFNGSYYAIIVPDTFIETIEKEDNQLREKKKNNGSEIKSEDDEV